MRFNFIIYILVRKHSNVLQSDNPTTRHTEKEPTVPIEPRRAHCSERGGAYDLGDKVLSALFRSLKKSPESKKSPQTEKEPRD